MPIAGQKALEGWKQIAHYLGKSSRTVQRWRAKGLPVHHHELLGLIAYPSELDDWRRRFDQGEVGEVAVSAEALDQARGAGFPKASGSGSQASQPETPLPTESGDRPSPSSDLDVKGISEQSAGAESIGERVWQPQAIVSGRQTEPAYSLSRRQAWFLRCLIPVCVLLAGLGLGLWFSRRSPITRRSGPVDVKTTGITRLTGNGHLKLGPLSADWDLVYFTEFLRDSADGRRTQAAVKSRDPAQVVYPAMPSPRLILISLLPRGGRLYSDWRDGGRLFLQRKNARVAAPLDRTRDTGRVSPDGSVVAFCDRSLVTTRDLVAGAEMQIELPGETTVLTWRPDGKSLWVAANDPITHVTSLWEVDRRGRWSKRVPIFFPAGVHIDDGAWTSDGLTFVFSELPGVGLRTSVWTVSSDGMGGWQTPEQVKSSINFRYPTVAPDNSAIFAIGSISRDESVRYDPGSREWSPVWGGISAVDVAFSHDRKRAAYVLYPELTMWICDVDGSSRRQITQAPLAVNQPHWSPDDTEISFTAHMPSEPWRDYVVPASGGVFHEIAPEFPVEPGPATWSGDGRYMIFGERKGHRGEGDMEIHIYDVAHGTVTALSGSRGRWSPRWSPDGRYILATAPDFGSLWAFDWGRQSWRLLTRMKNIDSVEWSSDSAVIQFSAQVNEKFGVFRLALGTRQIQRVADLPQTDGYVSLGVAPDGGAIGFRQVRTDEIYRIDWKRSIGSNFR